MTEYNDDPLEMYGGIRIGLTDDDEVQLIDDEQDYEATFDIDEWEKAVDFIHTQRCRRMQ